MADLEGGDARARKPSLKDVAALIERARTRPEDPRPRPKFTWFSWVCVGLIVAPVLSIVVMTQMKKPDEAMIFVLPAVLLGVFGLAKAIFDFFKPGAGNRRRAETAVKAYLKAVSMRWWSGAEMFLSWSALSESRARRPEIRLLNITGGEVSFGGRPGIESYWGDFSRKGRAFKRIRVSPPVGGPDGAWVSVEITFAYDVARAPYGSAARSEAGFVGRHVYVRVTAKWPVYQRDGLWYVLSAAIPADAKFERTGRWGELLGALGDLVT